MLKSSLVTRLGALTCSTSSCRRFRVAHLPVVLFSLTKQHTKLQKNGRRDAYVQACPRSVLFNTTLLHCALSLSGPTTFRPWRLRIRLQQQTTIRHCTPAHVTAHCHLQTVPSIGTRSLTFFPSRNPILLLTLVARLSDTIRLTYIRQSPYKYRPCHLVPALSHASHSVTLLLASLIRTFPYAALEQSVTVERERPHSSRG